MATNCSGERSFSQLKRIKDVKPVVYEVGVQAHPQKVLICWKSWPNPWKCCQNSENLGKIPENPNKIPKYLSKIPENLGKMVPNVVWLQKMAPNVCRKTSEDHLLGGHTTKMVGKSCTTTFLASLGKFGQKSFAPPRICLLLHLLYVSNDQQWVNNVLVHWHFCVLKVICLKNWLKKNSWWICCFKSAQSCNLAGHMKATYQNYC